MTSFKQGLVSGLMAAFAVAGMAGGASAQTQFTPNGDPWMPQHQLQTPHMMEQHEMLKPHEEFVRRMRNCCNLRDGRGNLEEIINDGQDPRFPADPKFPQDKFPYIVIVTHELTGKSLEEPTVVYVPQDKVVSKREALETCKGDRLLKGKDSTCKPPSFNVLWAYDNSMEETYRAGIGKHRITTLYCYYPLQPGT